MDIYRELLAKFDISDERSIRIFEEFVTTKRKLEKEQIENTIVMFGSARIKEDDKNLKSRSYYESARILANKLALWAKEACKDRAKKDKLYICTGGGGGIMEAANRGASDAGEPSIGFNILLPFEQEANAYIPEELVFPFHYFFIRKFYFAFLAKAFVVFPGGFGTFDELYEILTLDQTKKMRKTIPFVLFGKEFFEKALDFDMLLEHGFISPEDKNLYIITDDINEAFEHITKNLTLSDTVVSC